MERCDQEVLGEEEAGRGMAGVKVIGKEMINEGVFWYCKFLSNILNGKNVIPLYMKTYLISYDLNAPGNDYSTLIAAIKKIGLWWHCLDSTWIVKTDSSAAQIRDYLAPLRDSNDELLVVRLEGEGAWIGFGQECSDWLKTHLTYE